MTTSNRIPVLTPQGHLMLAPADEARTLPGNLRDRLESAFERGAGHGLLELGIREVGTALPADFIADVDLVITSYGALLRYDWLSGTNWRVAVIDEAQAIKNPGAKQTRAVKKLIAHTRIALTGTPVENRLSDLWSIFDFTHPGLLGSGQAFGRYIRRLAEARTYGPLRELVRPYILRRLKTDKSVIADLPDKTEMKAFCYLSATQAALYQKAVEELADALDRAEGMGRKGSCFRS